MTAPTACAPMLVWARPAPMPCARLLLLPAERTVKGARVTEGRLPQLLPSLPSPPAAAQMTCVSDDGWVETCVWGDGTHAPPLGVEYTSSSPYECEARLTHTTHTVHPMQHATAANRTLVGAKHTHGEVHEVLLRLLPRQRDRDTCVHFHNDLSRRIRLKPTLADERSASNPAQQR